MKSFKNFKIAYLGGGILGIILLVINLGVCFENRFHQIETIFLDKQLDEKRMAENRMNPAYDIAEYYYMNIYTTETDVVFVGDSLTARVNWNEIYPELNVKNRGIGSDVTSGLLARIDSIVQTEPQKIFILIGINDIGSAVPFDETKENYYKIVSALKEKLPNSSIYVQSILPTRGGAASYNEKILTYNAFLKTLSEDTDIEYVDLWSSFVDTEGLLMEEYSYDGIHITSEGYRNWKRILDEYIL